MICISNAYSAVVASILYLQMKDFNLITPVWQGRYLFWWYQQCLYRTSWSSFNANSKGIY